MLPECCHHFIYRVCIGEKRDDFLQNPFQDIFPSWVFNYGSKPVLAEAQIYVQASQPPEAREWPFCRRALRLHLERVFFFLDVLGIEIRLPFMIGFVFWLLTFVTAYRNSGNFVLFFVTTAAD